MRTLFWLPLFSLSQLWAMAYWIRRHWIWGYLLKPNTFPVSVISVGNIHSGGSGKTPLVVEIAKRYNRMSPVIVSRGYRAKLSSEGARVDLTNAEGPAQFGDEPWMMAQRLKMPVFIGKKRARSINAALQETQPKVILLDDGFQHLAVHRNLDILAINSEYSAESGDCLPLGTLRESISSLSAAHVVVLFEGKHQNQWISLLQKLFPSLPVFVGTRDLVIVRSDQSRSQVSALKGLGAFCGIARPESFREVVSQNSGTFLTAFPDHHKYSESDVGNLITEGEKKGCNEWVTTEKDWFKVDGYFKKRQKRLACARLELKLPNDFWGFLEERAFSC